MQVCQQSSRGEWTVEGLAFAAGRALYTGLRVGAAGRGGSGAAGQARPIAIHTRNSQKHT